MSEIKLALNDEILEAMSCLREPSACNSRARKYHKYAADDNRRQNVVEAAIAYHQSEEKRKEIRPWFNKSAETRKKPL